MIAFSEADPEVIREINLFLLESGQEYIAVDPSLDDQDKLGEEIQAVPATKIQEVLDWMGDVPEERFEWAWSRFMAGNIAQQLWPDGNHRTSFLFLEQVAKVELDRDISLSRSDHESLLDGSKTILQQTPVLPGTPVFKLEDLDAPTHPYRKHFSKFEDCLIWD